MAKKIESYIKLQVPANEANPSPPVGPALGQHGVNIMEFCKAFNAKTQEMEPGAPCPTIITYYQDKSFSMEIKTPPASYFLKKAAKLQKGSGEPSREVVGTVTESQLREIAELKMQALNANSVEQAMKIIAGFATFVAAWDRIRNGNEPIAARADLGHGQNFLYMLSGEAPDEETGDEPVAAR